MSCTGSPGVLGSSSGARGTFDCDRGQRDVPLGEFVLGFDCLVASFEPFVVVSVMNMKSRG
jgi:hypothetical protein